MTRFDVLEAECSCLLIRRLALNGLRFAAQWWGLDERDVVCVRVARNRWTYVEFLRIDMPKGSGRRMGVLKSLGF